MSANRRSRAQEPDAPKAAPIAVGVDGCPGGWIAAVLSTDSIHWHRAAVGDFADLIRTCLPKSDVPAVLAVDMPIGLMDQGWRDCDLQAKAALGAAGARVFLTPPREIVQLGPNVPNEEVQRRCREMTGKGISRQALALAPRILEVDRCLPDPRIVEAHPELSFAAMAGRVLASKHGPAGIEERIAVLDAHWLASTGMGDIFNTGGTANVLDDRPSGVPVVDALDALAVAWTAQRHLRGVSRSTPEHPLSDQRGVPMAIIT